MALGSLAILFKRHHVHRTHAFQFAAHLAIGLVARREFVAGQAELRLSYRITVPRARSPSSFKQVSAMYIPSACSLAAAACNSPRRSRALIEQLAVTFEQKFVDLSESRRAS